MSISCQIPAQNQRGRRFTGSRMVIIVATTDLAKSGAVVKPYRGAVAFVDLEKDGAAAEAGEPAQVQIEQAPCEPAALRDASNCDRKDFCLVRGKPRDDETAQRSARHGAMSNDVAFAEEALDFVVAPAATERGGVQGGD